MKKWIPDQVYVNNNEAKEALEFLISQYAEKSLPYVFGIALQDNNELIGHVGLSEIKQGVEIGYAIGEHYQSYGYATEAINAFALWSKKNLNLIKFMVLSTLKTWLLVEP